MRFEEAVAQLDRRQPEHMPEPSLDRIRALSELLDDPQLTYPTIHVTGTNGKTTIARAAADVACAHGVKTGLFTSPHLRTVRERLSRLRRRDLRGGVRGGVDAPRAVPRGGRRRRSTGRRPTSRRSPRSPSCGSPTSRWVSRSFEVGMGGSWDATNLVAGDVAVIGEIGLDHPGARLDGPGGRDREGGDHQARQDRRRAGAAGRGPEGHRGAGERRWRDAPPGRARLGGDGPTARGGRAAVPRAGYVRDLRRALPPDVRRARRPERGRGDRRRRVLPGARARSGRHQDGGRGAAHPRPPRGGRALAAWS